MLQACGLQEPSIHKQSKKEKFISSPFFITVYEGDKSWVGRETKKDCYQRNETIDAYILTYLDKIKHGVITREKYFEYIL